MALTTTHRFQAKMCKIWMMRHVNVPEEIGRALAQECADKFATRRAGALPKHVPVVTIVAGCSNRTTLVPAGGAGHYRLQIVTKQRKAAAANSCFFTCAPNLPGPAPAPPPG